MIIVRFFLILIIAKLNFKELENDKVGGSVWIPMNLPVQNTLDNIPKNTLITEMNINDNISPGPRKGHSMVYYQDYIILYGGEGEKGLDDENFYRFSFETKLWSILKISGVKPGLRAYHSMNFFKRDTLVIFGGKIKENKKESGYKITNSLIYVDLKMMDCSNPFIGDIGPTPRFGHKCAYNLFFNKGNRNYEHCICSGLDQTYCSMDLYFLKEIELTEDKKWVYAHKNMHSEQKIDGSDEVFEIAKRTIIQLKKKYEEAVRENNAINKIYSEYFQSLSKYTKKNQEDAYSSNEKKSKFEIKKIEIEKEKREITSKSRELKDYNNLLNNFCTIQREKYQAITEFLTEYFKDIDSIDKLFEFVNKMPDKLLLFSGVNLDSLTVKRRNYKSVLEQYIKKCKEYSLFEKSIYDDIIQKQLEQKEKFKNMYFIIDDKQQLSFKEEKKEEDYTQNIIE